MIVINNYLLPWTVNFIVYLVLLPIITSTTLKQGYLSKKQHSCRIEETNQDTVVVKARTPRSRKVQNG